MKNNIEFIKEYLSETEYIIKNIDVKKIEKTILALKKCKNKNGRVFILGVGGSAANCSHMVNDLRKICGIESYAPTDNVSELTANTNDSGWEYIFSNWLKISKLNKNDIIFILSVGGGSMKENISVNLINAIKLAKKTNSITISITANKKGYSFKNTDFNILIPVINKRRMTPHAEASQALLWHLLVSSPLLADNETKWESIIKQNGGKN